MPWQKQATGRFRSARNLGRELHKKLKPEERGRWSAPALGNKVAELMKGKPDWWLGTGAVALRVLAEMLSVEIDELVGAPDPTEGVIDFPEFPALPPLHPEEPPFGASAADSLLALVLERRYRESHRWIVAPPGAGKSFVIRYLSTRAPTPFAALMTPALPSMRTLPARRAPTPFVTATVQSLEGALAFVKDRSTQLVVEVEEPSSTDRDALHALERSTHGCTVLAPFDVPERAMGHPAVGYVTGSGWTQVHPPSFARWRDDFVDWIAARIESVPGRETHLDAGALREWLLRHDPDGALVSTPADMLALCADFDLHGDREATLRDRARRWLRDIGLPRVRETGIAPWNGRLAQSTYAYAVSARLTQLEIDYGHTSATDWEGLLASTTGRVVDPRSAVTALLTAGLLRPSDGGLVPLPRWVTQGLSEERLAALFDDDDTNGWGLIAADEARTGVVDRALDRRPVGAFRRLAKRAVGAFDIDSLGRRAALEALFAACARRAEAGVVITADDEPLWHEVVRVQLGHLEGSDTSGDRLTPYTRRDPEELLANAWALSLALPRPESVARPGWYLPAWSDELRLAALPPAFPPGVGDGTFEAANRVCRRAVEVVHGLAVQDVPEHVPLVLLPGLLLDVHRPWPLHPHHLRRLHSGLFEEDVLLRGADTLDAQSGARLAARLWQLLADDACVVERLQLLENDHPRLSRLVLTCLSPAEIETTVQRDGLHVSPPGFERDPHALRVLARPLRDAALRAWSQRAPILAAKWLEAFALLPILDAEDVDLVAELVAEADNETGAQLATAVWRDDPHRALSAALAAVAGNVETAGRWFWTATRDALPSLASALEGAETRPLWGAKWADRRAHEGGPAAERLYAYARV